MTMLTKIVVGIDGTKRGLDALALGRLLARETGASLVLASVYNPHRWGLARHGAEDHANAERLIAEAREALAGVRQVDHRPVAAGSPAQGLQKLAEAEGADLIVVGSSHLGPAGRVRPGGVGASLLHGAPCAVAVAPVGFWGQPDCRLRVIGVGYQETPDASVALRAATQLALHEAAALRVICVVEAAGTGPTVLGPYGFGGIGQTVAHPREAARIALDAAVDGLPPEARAKGVLLDGDVVRELADESRTLDLLVVGSRGHGAIGRVLLGSVSARLIRRASCPVCVVPSHASAGASISDLVPAQAAR